jgi:hypothetical protein
MISLTVIGFLLSSASKSASLHLKSMLFTTLWLLGARNQCSGVSELESVLLTHSMMGKKAGDWQIQGKQINTVPQENITCIRS